MARGRVKISRIENQRARKAGYKKRMQGLMKKTNELTILCNVAACLIFYSRDDNKLVPWPSHEVAKSLLDKYFSLPPLERNMKAVDQESFIKSNIEKIEKKLADTRKVITELEMDDLIFQLQMGRRLDDLTETEVDKLITYSNKKIISFGRDLGSRNTTSVNEPSLGDETLRASTVASEWGGNSSSAMGSGTIYYMDQWLPFDDANVQNHSDETHLPKTVSRFNLNLEPSDDQDVETYPGESSKSGGADDA